MNEAKKLTAQIMVRLEADTLVALTADADENGRTVAQSVRHAVKRYLASTPSPSAAGRTEKREGK